MKPVQALVGAELVFPVRAQPERSMAVACREQVGLEYPRVRRFVDPSRAQDPALLSVIVSKRKMFSGVILISAPKEREWNL